MPLAPAKGRVLLLAAAVRLDRDRHRDVALLAHVKDGDAQPDKLGVSINCDVMAMWIGIHRLEIVHRLER